jgi:hypothetical protein
MRKLVLWSALGLAACTPPAPPADEAAQPAQATETGLAAPPAGSPSTEATGAEAAAPDAAPAEARGGEATPPDAASPTTPHAILRGRVSYPSEELPAMRVCALATEDMGLGYCAQTAVNAPHYELRVPPGTWILLAWPQDTGTEGAPGLLSMASECLATSGLNCDDHGFLELTLDAGETREGLDINDWYYPPEAPPLPMEPRGEVLE